MTILTVTENSLPVYTQFHIIFLKNIESASILTKTQQKVTTKHIKRKQDESPD